MPNRLTITFGIEFEYGHIYPEGDVSYRHIPIDNRLLLRNWHYQSDLTAGCEISTPIFTSLQQAVENISQQFRKIVDNQNGRIPYFFNERGISMGQHVHIGIRRGLETLQKVAIATHVAQIYPLLAGISANPIPSQRGQTGEWCRPIWLYDYRIPNYDHRCEISASPHQTVEFRLFDANIPQPNLVNVFLMREIAKKVINSEPAEIDRQKYRNDRTNVLRYGLPAINILEYLEKIREKIGNVKLPNIPSIKELLYLTVRYGLNAYNVYKMLNLNPQQKYEYFKVQITNCDKFLENILKMETITLSSQLENKIERWISEAKRIEDLNELIGISRATIESLRRYLQQQATIQIPTTRIPRNLPRSYVAQQINLGNYRITRITGVYNLSTEEVAQEIERLLRHHGDNVVNVMTWQEVIECRPRFYVLSVLDRRRDRSQIVGCVAIDVSTGEIMRLVVDRRYRRLGVARLLVTHVLRNITLEGNTRFNCWIRKQNTASLNLFKSLGFRIVGENNRSYRLVLKNQHGGR